MAILQFSLDVLYQHIVPLGVQFLHKFLFLRVIDDRNQDLIHKPKVVIAHEDIIGLEDSLCEGLEKRHIASFLLETTKGSQDGGALHLPTVVLQHQQDIGRHRDVYWMICP
jgi:hypothetical protein